MRPKLPPEFQALHGMRAFGRCHWCALVVLCGVTLLLVLFWASSLAHSESAPHTVVWLYRNGMGNQMFQYAFGLGVAHQHPESKVCVSGLGDHFSLAFANSAFDTHIEVLNTSGLAPIGPCSDLSGIYRPLQLGSYYLEIWLGLMRKFSPPHSIYIPTPVSEPTPLFVWGCMQSFKYFQHVPHPFFRLRQMDAAGRWLSQRRLTSVVHVRRGDKIWDASSIAPASYYEKALRALGHSRVAVCTDDPQWVRAQRVFENATLSVGHDPGFDMALLAAATEAVVIGTGTFGWWGAYLSTARRKFFYAIVYKGADLLGYREADYIPHGRPGQGVWAALH
jgi:hypothetical protein